jgi:Acetyltransferase (GNAT) domain
MEVELVSSENEHEYAEFVDRCPNALVQHTMAWSKAITEVGMDTPVYLLARSRGEVIGALPAFLYKSELGNLMLSIPQAGGYGGVIVDQNSPQREETYAALLARLVWEGEKRDCLCVTVCTPPFFGNLALYRKYFQSDFEKENFYQYLELGSEAVAAGNQQPALKLRENIRRNIRKAQSNNLIVTTEDNGSRFASWYDLYKKRMRQINAEAIPRSLFEGIRRHVLTQGYGFLLYVLSDNDVIGGGVFVGHNQVIDYFMASADPEQMDKQPNSLLMYEAIKHATARGYRYWNWQSSASRQSPVYSYKSGWGSHEGLHYYLTKAIGDTAKLRRTPLSIIREEYRWHYVMPFEVFDEPSSLGGVNE